MTLPGNLRFLLQPVEEGQGDQAMNGAPMMIRNGALGGVNAVIALHIDSTQRCGEITIREGVNPVASGIF